MVQIVEQTKEEKVAMCMKWSKRELIEMLIFCNDMIDLLSRPENRGYYVLHQCDICGCHPSPIYHTGFGTFCGEHVKWV